MNKILTINPGSTSTKIGIFSDREKLQEVTLRHSREELSKYEKLSDQYEFRKKLVLEAIKDNDYNLADFTAIGCRGGIFKTVSSGTYFVNQSMVDDCKNSKTNHPSNLAPIMGYELGKEYNLKVFVTDPPVMCESEDIAKISGQPLFERKCRSHALNHKAIAKMHCEKVGVKYNEANLVVAHIGGGISIGVHRNGVIVDSTDPMDDGPFSPERAGTVPTHQLVDLCFSGDYSHGDVKKLLRGKAGFIGYIGTNDAEEVEEMVTSGDPKAKLIFEAFVYQISKQIAAMSVNVDGNVDAILITGGLAHSDLFVEKVTKRVAFIADVHTYPGEMELEALAFGALDVITGKEQAKQY